MKQTALSQLGQRTAEPPISWLMRLPLENPKLISLAAGFTDSTSMPVQDARELLDDLLRTARSGSAALQYGSTVGDHQLRRLTAERIASLDRSAAPRGHPTWEPHPDHVLVTHGSQQMLYMLAEALCDPGDILLVEDPTYFVFLGIMQSHGLRGRGIPLERDGIDLAHLDRLLARLKRSGDLPRVKALYLVSYHQNPTGTTTSFEKKAGALALLRSYERAAGHPIYLLEDAAYRELRFTGEDTPSALACPRALSRVLHLGTYSKPFATGVRVGFGLLPEPVLTAVRRIKGNHDFGTANLLQQLLACALSSGRFERHLTELRKRYAEKADVMTRALREFFPENVQWQEPEGGLYTWARLPQRMKSGLRSSLFRKGLAHGVIYVPGQLCYVDDPRRSRPNLEMRLSFGSAPEPQIRAGIRRLGEVVRELDT